MPCHWLWRREGRTSPFRPGRRVHWVCRWGRGFTTGDLHCHKTFPTKITAIVMRSATLDAPALRRVGLGHLAGGDSPRGSPWNGCGYPSRLLAGAVAEFVAILLPYAATPKKSRAFRSFCKCSLSQRATKIGEGAISVCHWLRSFHSCHRRHPLGFVKSELKSQGAAVPWHLLR